MRISRLLLRARLFVLRVLPDRVRSRTGRAALRAASLRAPERDTLRRNLHALLEPKSALRQG